MIYRNWNKHDNKVAVSANLIANVYKNLQGGRREKYIFLTSCVTILWKFYSQIYVLS